MILTMGPFSQKPKHPVRMTCTLSVSPFASSSSLKLQTIASLSEEWHDVPPQTRMCMLYFDMFDPPILLNLLYHN